jgi:hypothetical protein
VKVEINNETPDLLSFPIRIFCGISHVGVNYSTNLAINLAGVLYFGIFLEKLYLLYIGTEGVGSKNQRNMPVSICNLSSQSGSKLNLRVFQ